MAAFKSRSAVATICYSIDYLPQHTTKCLDLYSNETDRINDDIARYFKRKWCRQEVIIVR